MTHFLLLAFRPGFSPAWALSLNKNAVPRAHTIRVPRGSARVPMREKTPTENSRSKKSHFALWISILTQSLTDAYTLIYTPTLCIKIQAVRFSQHGYKNAHVRETTACRFISFSSKSLLSALFHLYRKADTTAVMPHIQRSSILK